MKAANRKLRGMLKGANDHRSRIQAIQGLAEEGSDAIPTLARVVDTVDDEELLLEVASCIGAIGLAALPLLVKVESKATSVEAVYDTILKSICKKSSSRESHRKMLAALGERTHDIQVLMAIAILMACSDDEQSQYGPLALSQIDDRDFRELYDILTILVTKHTELNKQRRQKLHNCTELTIHIHDNQYQTTFLQSLAHTTDNPRILTCIVKLISTLQLDDVSIIEYVVNKTTDELVLQEAATQLVRQDPYRLNKDKKRIRILHKIVSKTTSEDTLHHLATESTRHIDFIQGLSKWRIRLVEHIIRKTSRPETMSMLIRHLDHPSGARTQLWIDVAKKTKDTKLILTLAEASWRAGPHQLQLSKVLLARSDDAQVYAEVLRNLHLCGEKSLTLLKAHKKEILKHDAIIHAALTAGACGKKAMAYIDELLESHDPAVIIAVARGASESGARGIAVLERLACCYNDPEVVSVIIHYYVELEHCRWQRMLDWVDRIAGEEFALLLVDNVKSPGSHILDIVARNTSNAEVLGMIVEYSWMRARHARQLRRCIATKSDDSVLLHLIVKQELQCKDLDLHLIEQIALNSKPDEIPAEVLVAALRMGERGVLLLRASLQFCQSSAQLLDAMKDAEKACSIRLCSLQVISEEINDPEVLNALLVILRRYRRYNRFKSAYRKLFDTIVDKVGDPEW